MSETRYQFVANTLVFSAQPDEQLKNAIEGLFPLDYEMVNKTRSNNYQLHSTFDECLIKKFPSEFDLKCELNPDLELETNYTCDCKFRVPNLGLVAMEIEKANHEKILYDLLKAHIYLQQGAKCVLLMFPTERGRGPNNNNVYEIAKKRFDHCLRYGMISRENAHRIYLVGFNQLLGNEPFSQKHRDEIREKCRKAWA